MKTYHVGENCGYGLYVAPKALDLRFVGADGETLVGKEGAVYVRLPILLMLGLSPVIGGVFVLSFPLIVLAMSLYVAAQAVVALARRAIMAVPHLAVMRWEPSAAYLKKPESPEKAKNKANNTDRA